jgi:hypothetical protein
MAKLPTQHAVFVRKGLAGLRLRMADVPDPLRAAGRASLLDTFEKRIAAPSMVRIADAEERIARFEATLFEKKEMPAALERGEGSPGTSPQGASSTGDFFALLERMRASGKEK